MNGFFYFLIGIIFFSLVILFWKNDWYPKSYSLWKLFGKIVSLSALVGVCYGIYLLTCYLWPTPENLVFRKLAKNLAQKEIEPNIEELKKLNNKAQKDGLTPDEKKRAEYLIENSQEKRERYSNGKLTPPPKLASAQTQKTEWIMSLLATDKQMQKERENKQEPYCELVVCKLFVSDSEIIITYTSSTGKSETTKLTRWNKGSFYGGWCKNIHPERRSDNIELSLIKEDEAPFYLEGASGTKVEIFPQFKGYLGKNEIEVKVFKRVSYG